MLRSTRIPHFQFPPLLTRSVSSSSQLSQTPRPRNLPPPPRDWSLPPATNRNRSNNNGGPPRSPNDDARARSGRTEERERYRRQRDSHGSGDGFNKSTRGAAGGESSAYGIRRSGVGNGGGSSGGSRTNIQGGLGKWAVQEGNKSYLTPRSPIPESSSSSTSTPFYQSRQSPRSDFKRPESTESAVEDQNSSPSRSLGSAVSPDVLEADIEESGRGRSGSSSRGRDIKDDRSSRHEMLMREGMLPPARHRRIEGKEKDRDMDRRNFGILDNANNRLERIDEKGRDNLKSQPLQQLQKKQGQSSEKVNQQKKKDETEREVYIPASISVAQLAGKFGVKLVRLQQKMSQLDMSEEQRRPGYLLNAEEACNLALEFELNPVVDDDKGFDIYPEPDPDGIVYPLRPPVVAIMGHVDHGKTTLLDSLRHTSVAAGEAGGITQHIGAFSVPLSSLLSSPSGSNTIGSESNGGSPNTITFLDTPGHAAFTGMRARGASVTDLVVLVVAADDGVMPQTKEVIELVKSEGDKVGLVVAINKCDKPNVDLERVKSALGAEGVLLEEDGGDVPSVRVSGLMKTGLDDLVETLSTLAEIRDLRARRDGQTEGYILESRVDKGRGNVATVLVTRGTLTAGAPMVAGNTWCRVRQMTDSSGRSLRSAEPGTPVSVTGWKDLPSAGDQLLSAPSEELAKRCVSNRLRDAERLRLAADLEQINARRIEERLRSEKEAEQIEAAKESGGNVTQIIHASRRAGEREKEEESVKELRLIIKGDVSGTVEAVVGSLEGIGNKEARVKIIHTGVGDVSESDITLAEASGATVIGFSVSCPRSIQTLATSLNVPLCLDKVIYRLIETARSRVAALLPPKIEYRITGEAVVQQLFEIKMGRKEVKLVAGCRVTNGVISKNEGVRVVRGSDRQVIFEGMMETLKHLKKDVTEVRKGTECGIAIEGFNDVKEGDEIVTFQKFEVAREL